MVALESASVEFDIEFFTIFFSRLVSESLKGKPVARI
jgi:hypothetical protein